MRAIRPHTPEEKRTVVGILIIRNIVIIKRIDGLDGVADFRMVLRDPLFTRGRGGEEITEVIDTWG
jgi:hypothetical protein